jgi:transcriptional antiterminator NusG
MIDEPRNLTDAADAAAGPAFHGGDAPLAETSAAGARPQPEPDTRSTSPPQKSEVDSTDDSAHFTDSPDSAERDAAADEAAAEQPEADAHSDLHEVVSDEDASQSVEADLDVDAYDEDQDEESEQSTETSDTEFDDDDDLDEAAEIEEESEPIQMDWYILKVQSNRERSIAEALQRKIAIEGLDRYFGQVIVPTEKVTEFKGGKKKIVERKLWPGYIVVNMHINDDTWFAVRETSGIGDFTGAAGKPTPMQPHEVAKIVQQEQEESEEAPKLAIKFKSGDRVKVKEGNFENFEGEVGSIDEASGRVTVMINIFGRSTPVELEYWQIESL